MTDEAVPDVAAIVAEVRAEVERQRAAGAYPASLLDRLDTGFRPDEGGGPPEALLQIESSRSLRSTRPLVGGVIVAGKKAVRRLLAWYVAPIAADQTRFNIAILRDLRALERRLARVETPWPPAPGMPAADAWAGPDAPRLVEARVAAAAGILERARRDPVAVLGAGARYAAALSSRWPGARAVEGDPVGWLEAAPQASHGAIVLAGVLDRLSAAEVVRIMPLCAAALAPGGIVIADGPEPAGAPGPGQGGAADPTLRRVIGVDTIRVLAEAAGFAGVDRAVVAAGRWYVAWASLP